VTSATEASGTVVIAAPAFTFDGSPVICEVLAPYLQAATNTIVFVGLFEGATQIARLVLYGGGSTTQYAPFYSRYRFTPAAGSHTYSVTAFQSGGSGVFGAGGGGVSGYPPAFIRFTHA
jgi:hypothetical protein